MDPSSITAQHVFCGCCRAVWSQAQPMDCSSGPHRCAAQLPGGPVWWV